MAFPEFTKTDRLWAALIDPDKHSENEYARHAAQLATYEPSWFLVGGSHLMHSRVGTCVGEIKKVAAQPVVLFPGHLHQLHPAADGALLLSLISGRNADLLIGQHVNAAQMILAMRDKLLPTGYVLVDGGTRTSVEYVSQTMPLPRTKTALAVATAVAGEALGLKAIYLEAGSGAEQPVPAEMIAAVCQAVRIPLIVGGGLRSPQEVEWAWQQGANLCVVGSAFEATGNPWKTR